MKRLSCSHVTVAVCLCDSTPLRINCASGMCAAACVGPVTVRVRAWPGCVCVMMHRGLPVAAAAARHRVALGVGPGAGRAMARRKPEGHTAAAPPAAVTPSHGRTVTRSRCKSRPVTLSSLRAPPRLALRQLQAASPGEPEGARVDDSAAGAHHIRPIQSDHHYNGHGQSRDHSLHRSEIQRRRERPEVPSSEGILARRVGKLVVDVFNFCA